MIELGTLQVATQDSAFIARDKIRRLAATLGLDLVSATRLGTIVSETVRDLSRLSEGASVRVAGGYKFADYFRVGAPLTVIIAVLITWLIPLFFPF